MSCILHIETSTNVCSVAVSNEGTCIFNKEDHSGPNHAVNCIYVDEVSSLITMPYRLMPLRSVAGPALYRFAYRCVNGQRYLLR